MRRAADQARALRPQTDDHARSSNSRSPGGSVKFGEWVLWAAARQRSGSFGSKIKPCGCWRGVAAIPFRQAVTRGGNGAASNLKRRPLDVATTIPARWARAEDREALMTTTQNGADVILDLLAAHGIDCIFASPIAVMAPLWEALAARSAKGGPEVPRYFQCRHESLAVAVASGYYKATSRAQAVFLPTGLGVLHGTMALRTALQERTPMTVLSPDTLTYGEVPGFDPGPEWPSLLVDLAGPARDGELCVKWTKEAKTPGDLVNELRRALYFAEAIPKGPVLLSVPFD